MNASEARALAKANLPAQRTRIVSDIKRAIRKAVGNSHTEVMLYLHKGNVNSKDVNVLGNVPMDFESILYYEHEISEDEYKVVLTDMDDSSGRTKKMWINWEEE